MTTATTSLILSNAKLAMALCTGVVALGLLGGCADSLSVKGKVVPGDIGIVTIVDANDERLANTGATPAGMSGVKVEFKKGASVVASALSGPDGSFAMKVDRRSSGSRYDVVATGAGIYPVRSTSYPPAESKFMLIVADQRKASSER